MVIKKKDGKTENVTVNEKTRDGMVRNDLGTGDFDVEIDTGASFAVQKEVALEFMQETLAANPQVFPLIADLWASQLDVQFMQQMRDRLKTLVPPEILAKEEGKQPPPPKPNPQMQMMQMEMQSKQADIQNKMAEIKLKAEKLELEREQAQLDKAELMINAQKIQQEAQLDVFNHKADLEKSRIAHGLDHKKTELDFNAKIFALLSDIYKHNNPQEKKEKKAD